METLKIGEEYFCSRPRFTCASPLPQKSLTEKAVDWYQKELWEMRSVGSRITQYKIRRPQRWTRSMAKRFITFMEVMLSRKMTISCMRIAQPELYSATQLLITVEDVWQSAKLRAFNLFYRITQYIHFACSEPYTYRIEDDCTIRSRKALFQSCQEGIHTLEGLRRYIC